MKPQKILVTGGAGFIGFHVACALGRNGNDVTVVDNLSRGRLDDDLKSAIAKKLFTFKEADLTKSLSFPKPFDAIVHLAAINGTRYFYEKPHDVLRVNLLSCINVLEYAKNFPKTRLLFSSSSEAYVGAIQHYNEKVPTPEEIPLCIDDIRNVRYSYAASKIAGESLFFSYCHIYKNPLVVVRFHNIYGPRMGCEHVIPEFIGRSLKGEDPFVIKGGKETRAFCYVDDAADALGLLLSRQMSSDLYHIGNDSEEIAIQALAKRVLLACNVKPSLKVDPAPKGSVARRCPDITKLRSLGYAPKVNLDEGIKRTVAWYRKVYPDGF